MLKRKIEKTIVEYLSKDSNKIMIIDGARQIGKSYIIRYVASEVLKDKYRNYIELNFVLDSIGERLFSDVKGVDDFYLKLSTIAGDKMGNKEDTIVFIDEIQEYPYFLTLLKFLKQDDKFRYICSGSLLGVTLSKTPSIPIGSIEVVHMYQLDFEEFLIANNFGQSAIDFMMESFKNKKSLDEAIHDKVLNLFKMYLLVGGLPEAVNTFIEKKNIFEVRQIHTEIHARYADDAAKYDKDKKLKIKRIYDMVPSNLKNKKKRVIVKDIENKVGKRFDSYQDEFDYLINSGICVDVKAISTPVFPLIESSGKNLLKLYLNDVGLLTNILYKNNIRAVLDDENSINLGSLYEAVVASELKAHNHELYYYDNKKNGEVDFLLDDYDTLTVLPLEIKSGKDYKVHSAINKFIENKDYNVKYGIVLSNERKVFEENDIIYMPIYYVMFI